MRSDPQRRRIRHLVLAASIALLTTVLAVAAPPTTDPAGASTGFGAVSSVPLQSWRTDGAGRAVLKVGDVVYVGGTFSEAISPDGSQRVARNNLAAFDARTGALITSFRSDTDGRVDDLLFDGTSLFVAGSFRTIGGQSRSRVAALDPATGTVRTGFRADADLTVYSMSLADGRLWIAGIFDHVNGTARNGAAAVDPTTGAIDPDFAPVVTGTVKTIAAAPDGRTVYIGGPYTAVNGDTDAVEITPLDRNGDITGPRLREVTGFVDDLEVSPDGRWLIAGHSGIPGVGNRTAVYDTATGARSWRNVVDGDVQSVHLIGTTIYSGFHDGADGDGSLRLAAYDLASGAVDTTFRPHFDRFMGAWEVHGDAAAVVIAGDFSTVTGVRVEGFAIFPATGSTNYVASLLGSQSWRYLDDGSDQGTAWRQPGFDDGAWRTGIGEFGYGDGGERTRIDDGGDPADRHITTYFRTTFTSVGAADVAGIYMRVDDGAVVYLNGVEAVRDNMAAGTVGHRTLAIPRNGGAESSSRHHAIDPGLIRSGSNTVAVEVHQSSPDSSDLSFFATLVAHTVPPSSPPSGSPTTTTVPTTTAPATTAAPTPGTTTPAITTPSITTPEIPISNREVVTVPSGTFDLRVRRPWSALPSGATPGPGWTTSAYDDSAWSYAHATLGAGDGGLILAEVGDVRAVRLRFRAPPGGPLSIVVRAARGATVSVNGIAVATFPPASANPDGLVPALRLDRHVDVDRRLILSGVNVVAIDGGR